MDTGPVPFVPLSLLSVWRPDCLSSFCERNVPELRAVHFPTLLDPLVLNPLCVALDSTRLLVLSDGLHRCRAYQCQPVPVAVAPHTWRCLSRVVSPCGMRVSPRCTIRTEVNLTSATRVLFNTLSAQSLLSQELVGLVGSLSRLFFAEHRNSAAFVAFALDRRYTYSAPRVPFEV